MHSPWLLAMCSGVLLGMECISFGADVAFVAVAKVHAWEQTSPGTPLPRDDQSQFLSVVELVRSNSVSSATVSLPNGAAKTLTNESVRWSFAQTFSSGSALNFAAPNGSYAVRIQSSDGRKTNSVSLFGDSYPAAPRLSNFDAAQAIDPALDFTLRWDPPGTSQTDFIQVRVFSGNAVIFQSPRHPAAPGALNGAATSLTIPRNTLSPGGIYHCTIDVWRRASSDVAGYPGAVAWGAYISRTDLLIRTKFAAPDVHSAFLWRIRRSFQSWAGGTVPADSAGWGLLAQVYASSRTNITAASLFSAGKTKALRGENGVFTLAEDFASESDLNNAWPAGTFSFQLQTVHSGNPLIVISNPPAAYPPVPQVRNWNNANEIDAAADFELQWFPVSFATTNDFIRCEIWDGSQLVFDSGADPRLSALNGLATSVMLPKNTLKSGAVYDCRLAFLRRTFTDPYVYPGALVTGGFVQQTTAQIRTRGGQAPAIVLSAPVRGSGLFEFSASTASGRLYTIQRSTDLSSWTDYFITNAPGPATRFRIPVDGNSSHSAFRVLTR